MINILLLFLGSAILIFSSDWLIQGSVKLSILFKLTPLFIGLVVVAFGTSTPEAGVGIMAAIRDYKSIALGTVVGSNIANIGLILGSCALYKPFVVDKSVFKREMPIMLSSAALLYLLSLDLWLSRLDGVIFILFFIFFCRVSYKGAKKSTISKEIAEFKLKKLLKRTKSPYLVLLLALFSLFGIVIGADMMVRSGSALARIFGISPWMISVTIFAVGTSLPELSASLTAVFKKVPSISFGNIIGSNIFNILLILGIVALIRPINISEAILKFELPALIIFSLSLLIAAKTDYRISRKEGIALFLGYFIFIFLLFKR